MLNVETHPSLNELQVHVVEIHGARVASASPALRSWIGEVAARAAARSQTDSYAAECREIRELLKFGRFRATGRYKPAQEYLMRYAVEQGTLPEINAPVDLLNAVSLDCNVPMSLLSVERCSQQLLIDRGRKGESFVFNAAGQVLDLTDMLVICDDSQQPRRPVGSPVKDSLVGKITSEDRHLVAVIYSALGGSSQQRATNARDLLIAGVSQYEIAESVRLVG